MKTLLEILLSKYRKSNKSKFICNYIKGCNFQREAKEQLLDYLKSKFDGEEAKQIAEKFAVELQELPLQFGLFDDTYRELRRQRKMRIEWLKLLIENESKDSISQ